MAEARTGKYQRWSLLFAAAGASLLTAIGVDLHVNRLRNQEFARLSRYHARSMVILESAEGVIARAQEVNAPGNDVFSSRDPLRELVRQREANAAFDEQLRRFASLLQEFEGASGSSVVRLDEVRASMKAMREASRGIFEAFGRKDEARAARLMAETDRHYADILRAVRGLKSEHQRRQAESLESYRSGLDSSERRDLLDLGGLLAVIFGGMFYALRLTRLSKEAARLHSDERLRLSGEIESLFLFSRDLLCIAGLDGHFRRVSPSFVRTLGFAEAELLASPFLDFVHPDDLEATKREVEKLAKGEPVIHFENRYRTRDGGYRLLSWVSMADTANGKIYASARDLTEYRTEELRRRQLLQAIDQAAIIATTDARGVITSVNGNFCEVTGYSEQELLGKTHRLVNSGAHSPAFFREMWTTIRSGRTWIGDIENRAKNGSHYHVRTVITPIRDIEGVIREFIAIRFEISAQKQLEQQLIEAQSIARIGSWKFDLRTHAQIWSSEHYRIFEIDEPQPQEKLYRLYRERIHPDDLMVLDGLVERALKYGEGFTYNHRVVLDGGKRIKHVQGIGRVVRDGAGNPMYVSGTCRDRSAEVELERSLEAERLKSIHSAKLASLGEMAAGIAHEINNPLSIVAGSIPLLEKARHDDVKFASRVETLLKATERISKIVRGLGRFSRSNDHAGHRVHPLASIVQEAVVMTEAKARRHAVEVAISVEDGTNIECDSVEIEQVLVNLINNGIDALRNEADRRLQVMAHRERDAVVLRVVDSGPGIPPEIEDKLFQPFFTTKAVGEGTGLGLSIARGILEQHRATLTLNRAVSGTCFEARFRAPREEMHAVSSVLPG